MPRDRRPKRTASRGGTTTVIPSNSLVASAVRYPGKIDRIYRPVQNWQRECYRHYGICGEARFAARYFGNALSRCTLGVKRAGKRGTKAEPVHEGIAVEYLDQLFAGEEGQSQMLAAIGVHLTIAGECYLIGRQQPGNAPDVWEVASVLEVTAVGQNWAIDYQDGRGSQPLGDDDAVIRIWLQNPGLRIEADSPFRSLLPSLSEIEWATRHVFAQEQSRLAGAGLLLLPSEASFPPPPPKRDADGNEVAQTVTTEIDGIMAVLAEAMTTAIKDPSNPAALVPIPVKMPGEYVDKVKLLHFWSALDEKVLEMRSDAIKRFADGMDLPKEQVLGMSSNTGTGGGSSNGVSHWGAWQIEESTIKLHIEPMLEMIVNAITVTYFRKLTDVPLTDSVSYDTSALRLRPDRSKEAIALNAAGLVKDEVVLRENGFDPSDAMGTEEIILWLRRKMAAGSATPEMVAAAANLLGAGVPMPETNQTPNEARPDPSLEPLPTRPRTPLESGLLPAAEAIVLRALERTGNRIRQRHQIKAEGAPAFSMHTLVNCSADDVGMDWFMSDAFTTAPIVLEGVVPDVDKVIAALDGYVRCLLIERAEHERRRLATYLEKTCA